MNKSDHWIIFSAVILIIIHLVVLVAGIIGRKFFYAATLLNLVFALVIIGYRIIHELGITRHYIDTWEMIGLAFEVMLIFTAIDSLAANKLAAVMVVSQYVFFGIHLLVLLAFVVFMLTFKINKLW